MNLRPRATPSASVTPTSKGSYRLEIPHGERGTYRLAQLDDYAALPRRKFPHPAATLSLSARTSSVSVAATWGFGFWNDPFGFSLGFGGNPFRLPALPNAAWFFFASDDNYLSFRGDNISGPDTGEKNPRPTRPPAANGFLAQTFRSPRIPSMLLAPGAVALPLLMWRLTSRLLRRAASRVIREDGAPLSVDSAQWHAYRLEWRSNRVAWFVDEALVLESNISPHGPLGLVLWIDNQFAAWTPDGSLSAGTLANQSAWLEIAHVDISTPS